MKKAAEIDLFPDAVVSDIAEHTLHFIFFLRCLSLPGLPPLRYGFQTGFPRYRRSLPARMPSPACHLPELFPHHMPHWLLYGVLISLDTFRYLSRRIFFPPLTKLS